MAISGDWNLAIDMPRRLEEILPRLVAASFSSRRPRPTRRFTCHGHDNFVWLTYVTKPDVDDSLDAVRHAAILGIFAD
jgi:hypothetical protein